MVPHSSDRAVARVRSAHGPARPDDPDRLPRLPPPSPSAAGSVWVTAEQEGVVWRIEPGTRPITRTIDVGVGRHVRRLRRGGASGPRTTSTGPSPASTRDEHRRGSRCPSEPRRPSRPAPVGVGQHGGRDTGRQPAGVRLRRGRLGRRGPGRADRVGPPAPGEHAARARWPTRSASCSRSTTTGRASTASGYRSCDDSTRRRGTSRSAGARPTQTPTRSAEKLVALIGPYNSFCAQVQIPILNRAPDGPLAMISPSNTYSGLTGRGSTPPDGYRGEPDVYYPTGVRNYVRVVRAERRPAGRRRTPCSPGSSASKRVYVLDDGSGFWRELLTRAIPGRGAEARRPRGRLCGRSTRPRRTTPRWRTGSRAQAPRACSSAAIRTTAADRLIKALRARLGKRVTIMGGILPRVRPRCARAGRSGRARHVRDHARRAAHGAAHDGRRPALRPRCRYIQAPIQGVLEAGQVAEARAASDRALRRDPCFGARRSFAPSR